MQQPYNTKTQQKTPDYTPKITEHAPQETSQSLLPHRGCDPHPQMQPHPQQPASGSHILQPTGRKQEILRLLGEAPEPLSGTALARALSVSRQIIVQDIALLRAEGHNILSTYRGYVLPAKTVRAERAVRVFRMQHETEDTLDELQTIVDCGGQVLDVFIEHALYGVLRADLMIGSRLDAETFMQRMESVSDKPLKTLTGGCHYHTVTAPSERLLDYIESALREKHYLAQ